MIETLLLVILLLVVVVVALSWPRRRLELPLTDWQREAIRLADAMTSTLGRFDLVVTGLKEEIDALTEAHSQQSAATAEGARDRRELRRLIDNLIAVTTTLQQTLDQVVAKQAGECSSANCWFRQERQRRQDWETGQGERS